MPRFGGLARFALLLALLALPAAAYAACPADDTVISANTTYSVQVCAVDDVANNGVLQIGASSITLDCAGTVFVGSKRGIAIVNNGYDSVTIKNCLITDYNVGIWAYGGANSNVLRSNDINRTMYGIHVMSSSLDANIWDSNIDHNNYIGIFIANDANRAWIKDNNISDNNYAQIYLNKAGDANILSNKVVGNKLQQQTATNTYGIYLLGSPYNIIRDNNVRWNRTGVYVADSTIVSRDNNIYRNNIDMNNLTGIEFGSINQSISDNNISDNYTIGVSCSPGAETNMGSNIFRNNISYNGVWGSSDNGIYMGNCNDVNIHDNNIASNLGSGVKLASAKRILIKDNNIYDNNSNYISQYSGGILMTNLGSSYINDINIIGNFIYSNNPYGITMLSQVVRRVVIRDNNIYDSNEGGMVAVYSEDINVIKTTIRPVSGRVLPDNYFDIRLTWDTNLLFIDGNYLTISAANDTNTHIDRRWYIDINVVNAFTNLPINGAVVDINDQYTTPNYQHDQVSRLKLTTSSNGAIATQELTEFDYNSLGTLSFSPYDINVVASSYDSNLNYRVTLDSNKELIIYLSPSAKTVSITSPEQGYSFRGSSVSFSYSPSALIIPVKKYWVRVDTGLWVDNSTSTTYSTTVTAGSHTFSVRALGYDDSNSADANIGFLAEFAPGAATCGDGVCGSGETAISCAADCPPVCGDGACTHTETPGTCPADCVPGCGDNVCDEDRGETCSTCAADCGTCLPEEKPEEKPREGEIQQPISPFPGEMGKPACAGIPCDDDNPCTTDICFEGECSFIPKQDGTTCGFGMECFGGACVPVFVRAAGLPRIPIATEIVSMLISLLRLLGGEALEKAPLALALLIALAVIAALLSYNRLRIFMPAETLSTRHVQMLTAARAGVAIAFFVVPFVVNRMAGVNAGITAAIIGIAIILLAHYLKKRSMERKAIRV